MDMSQQIKTIPTLFGIIMGNHCIGECKGDKNESALEEWLHTIVNFLPPSPDFGLNQKRMSSLTLADPTLKSEVDQPETQSAILDYQPAECIGDKRRMQMSEAMQQSMIDENKSTSSVPLPQQQLALANQLLAQGGQSERARQILESLLADENQSLWHPRAHAGMSK